MSQSVLVGYASEHGSTKEIAQRLATLLGERGYRVDLKAASEVRSVDAYAAVVLGSAVHDGAWLAVAVEAVRGNAAALAARPVWLFSVGMSGALPRPLRKIAKKASQKVVDSFRDTVRPRDHHAFSGVIRREHLPRSGHVVFKLLGCRYGDYRDWDEVGAWACSIADGLASAPAPRAGTQDTTA